VTQRYLVTGGAGFIGSNYVRGLFDGRWGVEPASVVVLDNLTYAGNLRNIESCAGDPRLSFVKGSITNSSLVTELVNNVDVVVHFAAESHVDRSISGSAVFVETNAVGTTVLLEAARKSDIQTFLHVSTDEVYGSVPLGASTESDPLLPNSPYAASKASSDLVARSFFQTYGLDVRVTRCSNNFGPFQNIEKVIPLFITNLLDNKKVPLYGTGGNVRDWLHVDDHCRGIQLVIDKGRAGEIYNIGGGVELSNLELTHLILNVLDKSIDMIEPVADRLGHDLRYSVDYSKIKQELGYVPARSLNQDLPLLVEWYTSNKSWWSKK
jgi:dTDP-glucose 4,6-dehydratase